MRKTILALSVLILLFSCSFKEESVYNAVNEYNFRSYVIMDYSIKGRLKLYDDNTYEYVYIDLKGNVFIDSLLLVRDVGYYVLQDENKVQLSSNYSNLSVEKYVVKGANIHCFNKVTYEIEEFNNSQKMIFLDEFEENYYNDIEKFIKDFLYSSC